MCVGREMEKEAGVVRGDGKVICGVGMGMGKREGRIHLGEVSRSD